MRANHSPAQCCPQPVNARFPVCLPLKAVVYLARAVSRLGVNMSSRNLGGAGFALAATVVLGMASASAAPLSYHISFTDIGTYGVGGSAWNGSAVATASFDILLDPTALYLTQPIIGIITNLTF